MNKEATQVALITVNNTGLIRRGAITDATDEASFVKRQVHIVNGGRMTPLSLP